MKDIFKKFSGLLMVLLLAMTMVACDDGSSSSSDSTATDTTDTTDTTDPETATVSGNSVAMTDTDTSSSGKLKYNNESGMDSGTASMSFLYDSGEDVTLYFTAYGTSDDSSSYRVFDVQLDDGNVKVRGTDNSTTTTITTFTAGAWADVEVSWTCDDTTLSYTYDVAIDGTTIGTDYTCITSESPQYIEIKLNNNSGTTTYTTYLDDIVVNDGSSDVVNEDFDDYTSGVAVDTATDTFSTVSEAVISDAYDATAE
jgi:hypothetical protein